MSKNSLPPKYAWRFFRWFCHPQLLDHIEGDLLEEYTRKVKEVGKKKADIAFTLDVIRLFRPGIIKPVEGYRRLNTYGMYKSYFKIGWRTLVRDRGYSFINIAGLAIGLAAALMISLWVADELSHNFSFKNYNRIGAVYHHINFDGNILTISDAPAPIGPELKNSYPEFQETALATWTREHVVDYEGTVVTKNGFFTEPSFIGIFTPEILQGKGTLESPDGLLVSASLARDLLGMDAVGKTIRINNRDNFMVTGVFEDFPANSEFQDTQLLLPMRYYFSMSEYTRKLEHNWENLDFRCYVLMRDEFSFSSADEHIRKVIYEKASGDFKAINPEGFIMPMSRWHFDSDYKDGKPTGRSENLVRMFSLVGIFVLLLACINFINLNTARSERRSREVGIRKTMGSSWGELMGQFMSESLLVVIFGFLLALLIVQLSLPFFNTLSGKEIAMPWGDARFLLVCAGTVLFTSVVSGIYPSVILSSFKAVTALKGTLQGGPAGSNPRRVLVVFQFSISTVLCIATIVVFQQIQYAKNRPVGFDREGLFYLPVTTLDLGLVNYNTLREEMFSTGVIENMSKSDFPTTGSANGDASVSWEGKDPAVKPLIALNAVTHDFPATNGFQFIEGRDFSREYRSDSMAAIVNETAARLISKESVVGKKLRFASGTVLEIVGVVQDQIRMSPYAKILPHIYRVRYEELGYLTFRLKPGQELSASLEKVEKVIKAHAPSAPFNYRFIDEAYNDHFQNEERIGELATVFAALTILISCIGIFGLASFSANRRTREIGIRKVLGATIFNIWRMLSRDFILLVVVAAGVAIPIAYYLSSQWLEQYEYRIPLSWPVFLLSAGGMLLISLGTVSYHSMHAAWANPAKSLRSE